MGFMSSFWRGKRKAEHILSQPSREQRSMVIEQTARLNELNIMLKENELSRDTARTKGEMMKRWAERASDFYAEKNEYLKRGEQPPMFFLEAAGAHMRDGFKFMPPTADGRRITGGELIPIDDQGNLMVNLEFIDESGKRQVQPMTRKRESFEGGDEPVVTNMPEIFDAAARKAAETLSLAEETEQASVTLATMIKVLSAGVPEQEAEDQQWKFDFLKLEHKLKQEGLEAAEKRRHSELKLRYDYDKALEDQQARNAMELEKLRGKRSQDKDTAKSERLDRSLSGRDADREDRQAHADEQREKEAADEIQLQEAKARLKERVHISKRKADFEFDNLMYQDGNYPTDKANEELASDEFLRTTLDDISYVVRGMDGFEERRNGRPGDNTMALHRHLKTMAGQLSLSKRMDPHKAWDLVMEEVLTPGFDDIVNQFRGNPGWFHLPPGFRFPTREEDIPSRLTDVPGRRRSSREPPPRRPVISRREINWLNGAGDDDRYFRAGVIYRKHGMLPDEFIGEYPELYERLSNEVTPIGR